MKADPTLTVICPISRMAGKMVKVDEWVSSLLSSNVQIILVHDKQDDETRTEITSMVEKYSSDKIEFLENDFGNPGGARNAGLDRAKGEWICFWDSDDEPNVKNFLEMVSIAKDTETEVLIGGYEVKRFDDSQKRKGQALTGVREVDFGQIALNPGIWRMAFRRNFVQKARFPNLRMGEDQLFLSRLQIFQSNIVFFQKSVYTYLVGESSQLTSSQSAISDLSKVASECLEKLKYGRNQNLRFESIFLARQLSTLLIRGSIMTKSRATFLFIRYFLLSLKGNGDFFASILFIYKNSKIQTKVGK